MYEPSAEDGEAEEALNVTDTSRGFPLVYGIELGRVHGDTISSNDETEE